MDLGQHVTRCLCFLLVLTIFLLITSASGTAKENQVEDIVQSGSQEADESKLDGLDEDISMRRRRRPGGFWKWRRRHRKNNTQAEEVVTECGSTITQNNTIIRNPTTVPTNQACCYTINAKSKDICYLRLEMTTNTLSPPNINADDSATNGDCLTDSMTTNCSSGTNLPTNFCGNNSGQHVYLDLSCDSYCQICFNIGDSGFDRSWDMTVQQISCDSKYAPPDGCLQYYTGATGEFCNLGFEDSTSSVHLANQEYSICIKSEPCTCSITYSVSDSVTNGFHLSPPDGGSRVGDMCQADKLIIPVATETGVDNCQSIFCGQILATENDRTTNVDITSSLEPFIVRWVTNDEEGAVDQNGFCLKYTQNAC